MAETVQWAPYKNKMMEKLVLLSPSEITAVKEKAIIDLKTVPDASVSMFSAEKAEKICLCSFFLPGSLQYGLCTIVPGPEYRLPLFLSQWKETPGNIEMLVDFLPTVDFFLDKDFREKYLEPMGPTWEKFASLPGIWPEEDDALRSACSIIYTAARMPVEREGMRLAALAPHTEYLEKYIELIQDAVPADEAKRAEVQRKTGALRNILRSFFRQSIQEVLTHASPADVELIITALC